LSLPAAAKRILRDAADLHLMLLSKALWYCEQATMPSSGMSLSVRASMMMDGLEAGLGFTARIRIYKYLSRMHLVDVVLVLALGPRQLRSQARPEVLNERSVAN
jgi:hypothetical protein